ncbi:MAG: hypothetical protein M3N50_14125 [Pseudomonadota bacterium]|nr:hypothetical protein [Pseudomonadota bacterium]
MKAGSFALYLNSKHPDALIPSFMGHSIGHWEGNTPVIETVRLREETTLNFPGLPHSAQLRVRAHPAHGARHPGGSDRDARSDDVQR